MYANFISDGTVSIIAIILALYFELDSEIIILEEPERNIHPKLLKNLLSSAEDVSSEKQVIIPGDVADKVYTRDLFRRD